MAESFSKLLAVSKYDGYCSSLSIVCIVLGVALSMVAFFYPVQWDFWVDPSLSAQENEDNRVRQTETQELVYIISTTGLVLVTIGGILSAFLLSKYILLEECVETEEEQMVPMQELQSSSETDGQRLDHPAKNKSERMLKDGQKSKLMDRDYLQLNGASQQYGSTT